MINKLILSSSFSFDDQITSLVPLHSRGVDSKWMTKRAAYSVFAQKLAELKPDPKYSVLHVLAVGDEEIYSSNRNGDAFNRDDNIRCHPTFVELGKVYKHHKHADPSRAVGHVLASAHNGLMDRIELLMAADNDKCREEIQNADEGKDVGVSMGAAVDYDVCTLCKNKAPTAADHCECVRRYLNQVMADGTKVYMQNPNPKYFDISFVWKPADRIAYVLRKVAGANEATEVIPGHELADMFGLRGFAHPKVATLISLASMVKRIPAVAKIPPKSVRADTIQQLSKLASLHGLSPVIGWLHKQGWLLNGDDFAQLVTGRPVKIAAVDGIAYLEQDEIDVASVNGEDSLYKLAVSADAAEDLNMSCSMLPQHQLRRQLAQLIQPLAKVAMSDTVEATGLAYLHQHYKLAFAHHYAHDKAVLQNVARAF